MIPRRDFLSLGGAAALTSGLRLPAGALPQDVALPQDPVGAPFRLQYAPPLGMFRAHAADLVERLEWIAAQGFRAIEDNGMAGRPVEVQEQLRAAMQRLGLRMGVFVASADFGKVDFARDDDATRQAIEERMRGAVEVAGRVGATWCTVVPGRYSQGVEWGYQTARVIDNLKRAAAVCEPHGLVMVLEPLNWWRDHPGMFLHKIPQAYQICRAVGSPSCKILFDVYHQQITEGNLIPNIDLAWDEIAYFQVGDNPGRKEPGTGEIHYANIFKHLLAKGYDGLIGMEHGKSQGGTAGELKVVQAYRDCDPRD